MTMHCALKKRTAPLLTVMAMLAAIAGAVPAVAQELTPQQILTAADGAAGDAFGWSVAVDGNTAVVGASNDQVGAQAAQGSAYVFVRIGASWVQQQKIVGSDNVANAAFGSSVALDGDTMVVGAKGLLQAGFGFRSGAAYVFVRSGGAWVQQARLLASDFSNASHEQFGEAVAIDGDVIVVGASTATRTGVNQTGAAYVFERTGTTWVERGLTVTDGVEGDNLGQSIGISGTTVCVGAPGVDVGGVSNAGAVYLFTRGSGTWSLQQKLLRPTSASAAGRLGFNCAIEGDLLLAPTALTVQVATRSGSTWTIQQSVPVGSVNGRGSIVSIALSGDVAVVGLNGNPSPFEGAVAVLRRSGAAWELGETVLPVNGNANDNLGTSVSMSGGTVVAGAPNFAVRPGSVGVYSLGGAGTGAPGAPMNVQASANGNALSMTWGAPTSGGAPTSYTVLARTAPGAAPIATVPVGAVTTFAANAPNGTFLLSLTATNAAGTGPESASVTVTFPGGAVAVPGAPSGLGVTVASTTATFTWTAPASGGPPAGYVLLAGNSPGFATPIATLLVAVAPTSFAVPGVPAGTYYVRLVAQNAGGSSGGSNEVIVTVAGPAAPGAPTLNPATVSGHTVSLSWTPGGGGAPTSYVMTAFTSGGAVLASVPLTGTSASFAAVPSGSYAVRLVAVNGVGPSPVSNTITLVVP